MKRHQDQSCQDCYPWGFIKADLCGRNSTMNIAIVFLFIFTLLLLLLSLYYLVYYLVTTRRSNFIAHIRFNIVQALFLVSIIVQLIYLMDIFLHYSQSVYAPIDAARSIYVVALMFYTLYWIHLYIHTFSCARNRSVRYASNFFDILVTIGALLYMVFSFVSDLDSDDFSRTQAQILMNQYWLIPCHYSYIFGAVCFFVLNHSALGSPTPLAAQFKLQRARQQNDNVDVGLLGGVSFLSWVDDGTGIHQLRQQACKSPNAIFWPFIKFLAQLSILSPLLAFYLFLICHRNSNTMRRDWKEHSQLLEQQDLPSSQSRRVYNELSLLIGTRLSSGLLLSAPSSHSTL